MSKRIRQVHADETRTEATTGKQHGNGNGNGVAVVDEVQSAIQLAIDGIDKLLAVTHGPSAQLLKGYRGSLAFIEKNIKSVVAMNGGEHVTAA